MIHKAVNYKIISQLFIAMLLSTLLLSCDGESSSNIEDANIDSRGGGEVTIDGETVSPDDE